MTDLQTEDAPSRVNGLEEVIRAREDEFFRELAAQGHKATHPLMHMIASQRKLRSIGVPRHQLDPRAAVNKSRLDAKTSPYEMPQVLVEYIGRANSKASSLGVSNTPAPRKPREEDHGEDCLHPTSATRHRQFLSKTLTAVHEQLESTALVDISAQDVASKDERSADGQVLSAKEGMLEVAK